ncbi:hypothetical protein M0R72_02165 [Candidatus Pacearchaeota archaeon]|jgi:hypothetical protein|nr:hypothetical protein [Candidatus Pacearchaeota archaeon]
MKNFTANIEHDMAFLLSGDLKKSLGADEAISSLSKARNLLQNAGLELQCAAVDAIIKRAQTIDESDIEVTI